VGSLALPAEDGQALQDEGREGAGVLRRAHYVTGRRELAPAGKEQSGVTSKKKRGAEGGAQPEVEGGAVGGSQAALVTEAVSGGETPADLYSLRQLAGLLGVDRNRLAERVRDLESFPGPHRSRLYSLSAVEEALAEDPDPDIKAARLRKLVAEAGLAELRLKRESGELVAHRDVVDDWLGIFREFYILFTVTVPQRLAPRLKAKTAGQAEQILREELEQEFQEFRREQAQYLAEWDEAEGQQEEEADDEEG
jgi:hypothetical protein